MVVYQVYPRSFQDSDGDGLGDLRGITSRLDYIKSLGVDVVWLTPVYQSPNDDNGYDISDYRAIMREMGSMADFDAMLRGMHQRGIKLIMDLVANHSSDEHRWFQQSRSSRNNRVRQEIYAIMKYWLDKGVDGFRMDVIPFISKDTTFPPLPASYRGDYVAYYAKGPRLHEYLREMNRRVLTQYDVMTVGEGGGVRVEDALEFVAEDRHELQTFFNSSWWTVGAPPRQLPVCRQQHPESAGSQGGL